MGMIYRLTLFIALYGISLSCSNHTRSSSSDMEPLDIVELRPADKWLKFPVDEDTEVDWYPTVIEENGKEYIVISNAGSPQLLIYDVQIERCIKKITCQREGPNGVGNAYRYFIKNMNEIYWDAVGGAPLLVKVNGEGLVQGRYYYSVDKQGNYLPASEAVMVIDSLIYIRLSHYNHNQEDKQTHVAAVLDTMKLLVKQLPFYHSTSPTMEDKNLGKLSEGDTYVSWVYNGKEFIYTFGQNDSLYVVSPNHEEICTYNAKSKYLKPAKYIPKPHYVHKSYLYESNQQQFYHYIYYDKYREVYYRIAYPESEVDPKENQRDIWSFGRRTCSIVILDKNFRIIGETLLPDYRYQNRSIVVLKDGLYICDSHYKRDDYDENVWSFQRFDLVKK